VIARASLGPPTVHRQTRHTPRATARKGMAGEYDYIRAHL
jgi:hypothetical protein